MECTIDCKEITKESAHKMWYLSHWWTTKAQVSLRKYRLARALKVCSLYTQKYGCKWKLTKFRRLVPLVVPAWAIIRGFSVYGVSTKIHVVAQMLVQWKLVILTCIITAKFFTMSVLLVTTNVPVQPEFEFIFSLKLFVKRVDFSNRFDI